MDSELFYSAIKGKGMNINALVKLIGMTHTGLTKSIENNTLRVDTLEKISTVLGVSPCYFFDGIEKKEQKAKFDFLKEEILNKGVISINIQNYLENEIFSKGFISKEFIQCLKANFSKKEETELVQPNRYTPSFAETKKTKFEDYENDEAIRLLSLIRDSVVGKNNKELLGAYTREIQRYFAHLVTEVMSDKYVIFLIDEGIIDKKKVLYELIFHVHVTLELKLDGNLMKFLKKFFTLTEINEAWDYYIR